MSRYARRVDNNQRDIINALRKIPGVTVKPGHDDILVGVHGRTYWFEVKSDRAVSKRTNKVLDTEKQKGQKALERTWTGHYKVVTTIDEILRDIGLTLGGLTS